MFGPKVQAPPPAPQIDQAQQRRDQRDRSAARRATTILTGEGGLPDLGTVSRPTAG
ncbi:hypothetical protein ABTO53_19660 [Acinetobacter baumannii]